MMPSDFWTTCSANNIELDKDQVDALKRYHDELLYWNKKVNMISRKDEENVWERHFLHSLILLKYVNFPKRARVLDVGTGGGLPGIPLKIARPDLKMLLVDSVAKKVSMTQMFAQHTGLKDITVMNTRVEVLANEPHYQMAFDVVISRAVAKVDQIIDWVGPMMKPKAMCAFLKGGDLSEEIAEAIEHHPGLEVQEIQIEVFGIPWFQEDQKKVVLCRFD